MENQPETTTNPDEPETTNMRQWAANIRTWATNNGIKISPRGRLPHAAITAYNNRNNSEATK